MSERKHPSERDLLLAADGELTRRRLKTIEAHLRSCWSCRGAMRKVEETIATFVSARTIAAERHLPPDGPGRALLTARLQADLSPCRNNLSFCSWLFPSPLKIVNKSVVPLIVTTLLAWIISASLSRRSQITPTVFLPHLDQRRTSITGSKSGVTYQKISIRSLDRPVERSLYADLAGVRRAKPSTKGMDKLLEDKLASAGGESPLSGEGCKTWHGHQEIVNDEVSRDGTFLMLATTVQGGSVAKESLTVRERDFHPVQRAVEFGDTDRLTIAELNYAIPDWSKVDPSMFEPLDASASALPAKPRPADLLTRAELDDTELEAKLILNRLHADANERVNIERTPKGLLVKGVVASEDRRRELQSHLQLVPHLKVYLSTFDELKTINRSLRTGTIGSTASSPAPSTPALEKYLVANGWSAIAISEVLARLNETAIVVVRESDALADLREKFGLGQELSGKSQNDLEELISRHRSALLDGLSEQEQMLSQAKIHFGDGDDNKTPPATSLRAAAEQNQQVCEQLVFGKELQDVSLEPLALKLQESINQVRTLATGSGVEFHFVTNSGSAQQ